MPERKQQLGPCGAASPHDPRLKCTLDTGHEGWHIHRFEPGIHHQWRPREREHGLDATTAEPCPARRVHPVSTDFYVPCSLPKGHAGSHRDADTSEWTDAGRWACMDSDGNRVDWRDRTGNARSEERLPDPRVERIRNAPQVGTPMGSSAPRISPEAARAIAEHDRQGRLPTCTCIAGAAPWHAHTMDCLRSRPPVKRQDRRCPHCGSPYVRSHSPGSSFFDTLIYECGTSETEAGPVFGDDCNPVDGRAYGWAEAHRGEPGGWPAIPDRQDGLHATTPGTSNPHTDAGGAR